MSSDKWYFVRSGQQRGPVGREDLQGMLERGEIHGKTLVWHASMAEWEAAEKHLDGAEPRPPTIPLSARAESAIDAVTSGVSRASTIRGTDGAPKAEPQLNRPLYDEAPARTFGEAVSVCLRDKFAIWTGRASRSEFCYFTLFAFIAIFVASLIDELLFGLGSASVGLIGIVTSAILVIPSVTVGCRRVHDVGRPAWYYFGYIFALPIGAALFSAIAMANP